LDKIKAFGVRDVYYQIVMVLGRARRASSNSNKVETHKSPFRIKINLTMEMYPYYIGYIVILLASSLIGFLLLIRIWVLRSTPGAYGLILAIVCVIEWSLTYTMEIFSASMAEKILWAKLEYFGISYVALCIFFFAMHYSGRGDWLTPTRMALLAGVASGSVILAFTNDWHRQIWATIDFTNGMPFGPLDVSHGTVFIFLIAFQYSLIAATTVVFIQIAARAQSLYRSQSRIMLIGMAFPWLANFMYVTRLNPIPRPHPYCVDIGECIPLRQLPALSFHGLATGRARFCIQRHEGWRGGAGLQGTRC